MKRIKDSCKGIAQWGVNAGTVAAPGLTFTGSLDTGAFIAAANEMGFGAEAREVFRIKAPGATTKQIIIPLQNNAATPSLAFGAGVDGFLQNVAGAVALALGGTRRFAWFGEAYQGIVGGAAAMLNEATSATNPTLLPHNGRTTVGIGSGGVGQLSLIANSLDCINIAESGGARQLAFYVTAPVSLQTGVAVTAAGVHAALVALGLITA